LCLREFREGFKDFVSTNAEDWDILFEKLLEIKKKVETLEEERKTSEKEEKAFGMIDFPIFIAELSGFVSDEELKRIKGDNGVYIGRDGELYDENEEFTGDVINEDG